MIQFSEMIDIHLWTDIKLTNSLQLEWILVRYTSFKKNKHLHLVCADNEFKLAFMYGLRDV